MSHTDREMVDALKGVARDLVAQGERFRVRVRGIPTIGPGKWVALHEWPNVSTAVVGDEPGSKFVRVIAPLPPIEVDD